VRIIIIDAAPAFREQCARHIASHWPGADLELCAPTAPLTDEPDWARYDVLLIGHHADGQGHNALAWMKTLGERLQNLPPIILLSGEAGEDAAVQAMKLGASDFLRRDKVSAPRLIGAINDAILERARERDRLLARARLAQRYADTVTMSLDINTIGEAPPPDAPLIAGYRMLRKIGEGGTSRVFLAEQLPRMGQRQESKQVVLKVLNARLIADPAFIERFIREYRVISAVQNEHVARIYDQGITDDHLYIAMEYFAHGDLRTRIERRDAARLSSIQALRITMQIHTAGVIHRDLKPHNIMFRDAEHLALVDFGLAKQMGEKAITATGGMLATPLYMSPEQCLGREQDLRSDIYSTGVILYEMLTGERLFDSDNLASIAFQHVHAEIPRLPAPLAGYQTLLDRLLAKNPDDRFQSARELFAYIAY
jgi:tRNA A-37 threonylcarbamoyl transferase component Bud32/FixJ family two-component response regulator